jgi:hypothetical protein
MQWPFDEPLTDINKRSLITALGSIIGLAESNAWVENANFTAHHMLMSSPYTFISLTWHELTITSGGYHISNQAQRRSSISFLQHVEKVMGFKTQPTIDLLQSQWLDLD